MADSAKRVVLTRNLGLGASVRKASSDDDGRRMFAFAAGGLRKFAAAAAASSADVRRVGPMGLGNGAHPRKVVLQKAGGAGAAQLRANHGRSTAAEMMVEGSTGSLPSRAPRSRSGSADSIASITSSRSKGEGGTSKPHFNSPRKVCLAPAPRASVPARAVAAAAASAAAATSRSSPRSPRLPTDGSSRKVTLAPARLARLSKLARSTSSGDGRSKAIAKAGTPDPQRRVTLSSRVNKESATAEGSQPVPSKKGTLTGAAAGATGGASLKRPATELAAGGVSLKRRKTGVTPAALASRQSNAAVTDERKPARTEERRAPAAVTDERKPARTEERRAPVEPARTEERRAPVEKRTVDLRRSSTKRRPAVVEERLPVDEDSAEPLEEPPPRKLRRKRPLERNQSGDGLPASTSQQANASRASSSNGRLEQRSQAKEVVPPASTAMAPSANSDELTEAEKGKMREAVHAHLRKICDDDDAQVVTDFVSVMVEDRKSPAEMVAELTFFKEGASEFVEWVNKQISKIKAKRASNANAHQTPLRTARASGSSAGGHRAEPRRRQAGPDSQADVNPNAIDLTAERPATSSSSLGGTAEDSQAAPGDTVNTRKKVLLAERTSMLKKILDKLSVASGDERKKLQNLADTIQGQMKSLQLGSGK